MKKSLLTLMLLILFGGYSFATESKLISKKIIATGDTTISFAVNGTAACKSNIEAAVTANSGVSSASWDAGSKIITVTYSASSVKAKDLYVLLANAGYDNAELRAKKSVYDALSSACQYTRDPETE